MTCTACHRETSVSSRGDHPYTEGGLAHVVLKDIELRSCPSCGESTAVLPRLAPLHRALAREIMGQKRFLTASEVTFLRKMLDWTDERLAANTGLDTHWIFAWHSIGLHRDLTTLIPADRLLRIFVAQHLEIPLDIFTLFPQIQPTCEVDETLEASFIEDRWLVTSVQRSPG